MRTVHLLLGLVIWLGAILTSVPAAADDVDVRLDTFGVGSAFRPGEFTAIRIGLTSNLDEPTAVWVQWDIANADGDVAEYGRSLTLTPGRESLVWLYAPLPPHSDSTSIWQVRVLDEQDGQIGRDLGGQIISPADARALPVDKTVSMIGLIGGWGMRLDGLTAFPAGATRPPQIAHEDVRLVRGMTPRDLPDRWEGLRGFEVLAWGDARQNRPEDLTTEQARALVEYVARGGHLVIALPAAGNPWHLGAPGRLEPDLDRLMPQRAPRKDEDVKLDSLLPVVAKHGWKEAHSAMHGPQYRGSIRVFKDLESGFDVIDNQYEPLIALPDGQVVVIQRTYGFGRVTVIGIDLSPGAFIGVGSSLQTLGALPLPEADVFWNRILGWRADSLSNSDIDALEKADRLIRSTGLPEQIDLAGDRLVGSQINMSQSAAKGLLLALLLFAVYWVVAGPGGFALLKQYGKAKHAWLAFAATAAVFTALAWISVGMLRPRAVTVKHLTVLDYLARPQGDRGDADPQFQRASSYFSLYLPSYKRVRTAIAAESGQRHLLATWAPPLATPQPFPNVDRYRIDTGRQPAAYEVPSRATATQMYAHWLGGIPSEWGGVLYSDPEHPIRLNEQDSQHPLSGRIISDLPGQLTNITIYWISNKRLSPRRYETGVTALPVVSHFQRGSALNIGRMNRSDSLDPGAALDLGELNFEPKSSLDVNIRTTYVEKYAQDYHGPGAGPPNYNDRRHYLEMLSIYRQLTPPEYFLQTGANKAADSIIAQRVLGRDLDLSPWFNRPCLIIIGHLGNSDLPIPLTVGGEPPQTADGSLTVVRWIYPLPLDEDIAFQKPEDG